MKTTLREMTLERMKAIPQTQRQIWQASLYQQLVTRLAELGAKRIACYYSFSPEVETASLVDTLQQLGYAVYLPRVLPKRQLAFLRYQGQAQLTESSFHIMEPLPTCPSIELSALDAMIVPGTAFQLDGQRIGFGGGYYDRVLASFKGETIALCFPVQLYPVGTWQPEAHDCAVKQLLIPLTSE